jgi:hypothetical protein
MGVPAGRAARGQPWGVRSQLITPPTRTHGSVHREHHGGAACQGSVRSSDGHTPMAPAPRGQGCDAGGGGCSDRHRPVRPQRGAGPPTINSWSRHSRRTVPIQRSATVLALGARTGVQMIWTPVERHTSSNARVNLASRSRIRNLNALASSSSAATRLRACWTTQAPVGCAVTPARRTRRLWSSMTNSTYNRRKNTVSTVKKSQAKMPAAWRRRNARQVVLARRGAGSIPWARSTRPIELADTWQPRRTNSPWIRW